MNLGVHASFQIVVFSGYMPRSRIVESFGSSIFSFEGTSILFSTVAVLSYILTHIVGGVPFLHTHSSIDCLQSFLKTVI